MGLIVAFGNPVYDEIITPKVSTKGRVLSGCSTNACLALTRLGRQTALVGCIGDDDAERFVADLQRYGVAPYASRAPESGGFRLVYDQRGDRTLEVLGVAPPITTIPDISSDVEAVIIGPILQETPVALIERIVAGTAAPLFLDPQGLLRQLGPGGRIEHIAPADFAHAARHCTVVKANEVEARVLTGFDPRTHPAAAAQAIRALGCKIAIVTLAEAGSFIDAGDQQLVIPAFPTEASDPTGAGDTYLAGFVHAYLDDPRDLYRAGCMGAATASIWIEHTGPDAPIGLAEAVRRLEPLLAQRQENCQ